MDHGKKESKTKSRKRRLEDESTSEEEEEENDLEKIAKILKHEKKKKKHKKKKQKKRAMVLLQKILGQTQNPSADKSALNDNNIIHTYSNPFRRRGFYSRYAQPRTGNYQTPFQYSEGTAPWVQDQRNMYLTPAIRHSLGNYANNNLTAPTYALQARRQTLDNQSTRILGRLMRQSPKIKKVLKQTVDEQSYHDIKEASKIDDDNTLVTNNNTPGITINIQNQKKKSKLSSAKLPEPSDSTSTAATIDTTDTTDTTNLDDLLSSDGDEKENEEEYKEDQRNDPNLNKTINQTTNMQPDPYSLANNESTPHTNDFVPGVDYIEGYQAGPQNDNTEYHRAATLVPQRQVDNNRIDNTFPIGPNEEQIRQMEQAEQEERNNPGVGIVRQIVNTMGDLANKTIGLILPGSRKENSTPASVPAANQNIEKTNTENIDIPEEEQEEVTAMIDKVPPSAHSRSNSQSSSRSSSRSNTIQPLKPPLPFPPASVVQDKPVTAEEVQQIVQKSVQDAVSALSKQSSSSSTTSSSPTSYSTVYSSDTESISNAKQMRQGSEKDKPDKEHYLESTGASDLSHQSEFIPGDHSSDVDWRKIVHTQEEIKRKMLNGDTRDLNIEEKLLGDYLINKEKRALDIQHTDEELLKLAQKGGKRWNKLTEDEQNRALALASERGIKLIDDRNIQNKPDIDDVQLMPLTVTQRIYDTNKISQDDIDAKALALREDRNNFKTHLIPLLTNGNSLIYLLNPVSKVSLDELVPYNTKTGRQSRDGMIILKNPDNRLIKGKLAKVMDLESQKVYPLVSIDNLNTSNLTENKRQNLYEIYKNTGILPDNIKALKKDFPNPATFKDINSGELKSIDDLTKDALFKDKFLQEIKGAENFFKDNLDAISDNPILSNNVTAPSEPSKNQQNNAPSTAVVPEQKIAWYNALLKRIATNKKENEKIKNKQSNGLEKIPPKLVTPDQEVLFDPAANININIRTLQNFVQRNGEILSEIKTKIRNGDKSLLTNDEKIIYMEFQEIMEGIQKQAFARSRLIESQCFSMIQHSFTPGELASAPNQRALKNINEIQNGLDNLGQKAAKIYKELWTCGKEKLGQQVMHIYDYLFRNQPFHRLGERQANVWGVYLPKYSMLQGPTSPIAVPQHISPELQSSLVDLPTTQQKQNLAEIVEHYSMEPPQEGQNIIKPLDTNMGFGDLVQPQGFISNFNYPLQRTSKTPTINDNTNNNDKNTPPQTAAKPRSVSVQAPRHMADPSPPPSAMPTLTDTATPSLTREDIEEPPQAFTRIEEYVKIPKAVRDDLPKLYERFKDRDTKYDKGPMGLLPCIDFLQDDPREVDVNIRNRYINSVMMDNSLLNMIEDIFNIEVIKMPRECVHLAQQIKATDIRGLKYLRDGIITNHISREEFTKKFPGVATKIYLDDTVIPSVKQFVSSIDPSIKFKGQNRGTDIEQRLINKITKLVKWQSEANMYEILTGMLYQSLADPLEIVKLTPHEISSRTEDIIEYCNKCRLLRTPEKIQEYNGILRSIRQLHRECLPMDQRQQISENNFKSQLTKILGLPIMPELYSKNDTGRILDKRGAANLYTMHKIYNVRLDALGRIYSNTQIHRGNAGELSRSQLQVAKNGLKMMPRMKMQLFISPPINPKQKPKNYMW